MQHRDDEDGALPGGLSFSAADPDLPLRRAGWLRRIAWTLVLAGVLGAAGVAGTSWLRDADVRASLDSSTRTWSRALGTLTFADDVVAVAAAAEAAPAAADRVGRDLSALRSTAGARRSAVAGQLAAERDVLLALAALEGVDRAPLAVWGEAHARLTAAVDAEASSRRALRAVDERAARRLPDLGAVLLAVGATVGDALTQDVTQASAELLTELGAARSTADLRTAADRSAAQQEAVLAARSGLQPSGDGAVLDAFAEALGAVTGLDELAPADTSAWAGARAELDSALGRVAAGAVDGAAGGGADSLAAGSVRAQLPVVLSGLDRLVQRAVEAHQAWLPVRVAAEQSRDDDEAALETYGGQVQAVKRSSDRVRQGLAAVQASGQAEGGPVSSDDPESSGEPSSTADAATAVLLLADQVDGARADLAGLTVPAVAVGPHTDLLAFVTSTESSVRAAGALLDDDRCADCPAVEARGWSALERVAEDGAAWDTALARWEAAQLAALDQVAGRVLPPPPDA